MKGIVLVSHGALAKGMYDTTVWFMGKEIPQYAWLCLGPEETPEEFAGRMNKAIEETDAGEGVLVFCDLYGGTPCNCAALAASDRIQVISGMNLPMLLEQLMGRLSGSYDVPGLIEKGRGGILDVNQYLEAETEEEEDSLFDGFPDMAENQ